MTPPPSNKNIVELVSDIDPSSDEPEVGAEKVGGNGGSGDMRLEDRVNRIEVSVEGLRGDVRGLRHSQNITLTAVLGVGAILLTVVIGLGSYTLNRIDSIPAELTAITNTIANAIGAARSDRPIIIYPPQELPGSADSSDSSASSENADGQ